MVDSVKKFKGRRILKLLICFVTVISILTFRSNVKSAGCNKNVCTGYSGVRCYPKTVEKDLGKNTFCQLSITKVSYGDYFTRGGMGTYPKYIYDKVGFCTQHNNSAPRAGTQCYLKYYDGFDKAALAGLGRVLINLNAKAVTKNGIEKGTDKEAYVNIQAAQNDLLKKLSISGYRGNSLINKPATKDAVNAGLNDAFDYYYYTAKNNGFVGLVPSKVEENNQGTVKYKIKVSLPKYQYKGIKKSVSYKNYTVSFKTKSGVTYTSNCDNGRCYNDSNQEKSKIFSCFKDANGDFCYLNLTESLKNDLANNKATINATFNKDFYIAKLYDCGYGYQDLTLAETQPVNLEKTVATTIKFNDQPEDSCQSDFDKINDYQNLSERAVIYKKYEEKGFDYNNLFNLNYGKGDGDLACTNKTCSSLKTSCLSYSKTSSEYDFSCYSDISFDLRGNLNYICKTDFDFENNLETTNFNVAPGMKISGTDGIIATANLQKLCSSSSSASTIPDLDVDIIKDVKFNDQSLDYIIKDKDGNVIDNTITKGEELGQHNKLFDYSYEFYSPVVYLKKGTGEIVDKKLGEEAKGIFTNYNYVKIESGYIPFEISFKANSVGSLSSGRFYLPDYSTKDEANESNKCTYQTRKSLILKEGLNLEFRIIDVKNPFVNREGNTRNTMSNWCFKKENNSNYSKPIENIEELENSCEYNNALVDTTITKSTNSYGLNSNNEKQDPKYKILLTPELMKEISNEAKKNNITYDVFNLKCSNGKCKSKLINYLRSNNKITIK